MATTLTAKPAPGREPPKSTPPEPPRPYRTDPAPHDREPHAPAAPVFAPTWMTQKPQQYPPGPPEPPAPTLRETTDVEDARLLADAIVELIQGAAYDDMTWAEVDNALRLASHDIKVNWVATSSVKPAA